MDLAVFLLSLARTIREFGFASRVLDFLFFHSHFLHFFSTVAPFLSALHVNWTMWPNFASNVLLTVLKDGDNNVFVQMNHDRKPVQMGDCALQCPWDEFVSIASQSYIKDRDAQCQMRKRYVVDPFVGYLC